MRQTSQGVCCCSCAVAWYTCTVFTTHSVHSLCNSLMLVCSLHADIINRHRGLSVPTGLAIGALGEVIREWRSQ